MPDEPLTLQEAADFLRISTRTIERMVSRGDITAYRIDGVEGRRFLRSELLATLVPAARGEVPANLRKESA